jgi:hypothetical protein
VAPTKAPSAARRGSQQAKASPSKQAAPKTASKERGPVVKSGKEALKVAAPAQAKPTRPARTRKPAAKPQEKTSK